MGKTTANKELPHKNVLNRKIDISFGNASTKVRARVKERDKTTYVLDLT